MGKFWTNKARTLKRLRSHGLLGSSYDRQAEGSEDSVVLSRKMNGSGNPKVRAKLN